MRLHLKNISPAVHGMITEHKASHSHKNLDDTVTCLIKQAMLGISNKARYEDQTSLIRFHLMEIDRLKVDNCKLRTESQSPTPKGVGMSREGYGQQVDKEA